MDVQATAHLKEILTRLERSHRYVVLMYYVDELSAEEIGLVLDLPVHRVSEVLGLFRVKLASMTA